MAVRSDGLIFLSPFSSSASDSLIEVLNMDGSVSFTFGERLRFKNYNSILNDVCICFSKGDELFVAWKHFPVVKKYSKNGDLLSEFVLDHRMLKHFAKLNKRIKKKDGVLRTKPVIFDIDTNNKNLFILTAYPRTEIFEIDSEGKIVRQFWKDHPFNCMESQLLVGPAKDKETDIFFILNRLQEWHLTKFVADEL
jgi:hypothetical protein